MSPYDNAGRISKKSFVVSTLVLFVLCLISASARFYIRIHVQKQFATEDGILVFGISCLICAMAVLFLMINKMYLVGAAEVQMPGLVFPPDFVQQAYDFQKLAAAALILTWCSIVSVKFSYLFLFKKLIHRMRPMLIYWWFATVFNAIISLYGATVYIAACPDFYSAKSLQCAFGSGVRRSIALSISQMILDIIGDLLILYIPFRLIWKIRIRWTQKIALSVSLGLIVLTIVCTITRMSGIKTGRLFDSIDSIWETYWQFIAANLAIIMTAATAFRTFFVSRASNERIPEPAGSNDRWYTKGRLLLLSAFSRPSWRSKPKADVSGGNENSNGAIQLNHQIPRGTITGIRTMINGNSRTKVKSSQIMHSMDGGKSEDSWPPSMKGVDAHAIKVQRDITLSFDEVS